MLLTQGLAWVKASERLPEKEGDYFVIYTTGEKMVLYASGTEHHSRWKALVSEWLDESSAPQTDAVDGNDFTLWVVVNRWEYVTERHEWVNDYIGELKGVSVKYKKLVEIFKQQNK